MTTNLTNMKTPRWWKEKVKMLLQDKYKNLIMQAIVSMASMDKQTCPTQGSQQTQLDLLVTVIQIRPDKADTQQIQKVLIQGNQECLEANLRVRVQRVEEERAQATRDQRTECSTKWTLAIKKDSIQARQTSIRARLCSHSTILTVMENHLKRIKDHSI